MKIAKERGEESQILLINYALELRSFFRVGSICFLAAW
jgi:hypothetical protein